MTYLNVGATGGFTPIAKSLYTEEAQDATFVNKPGLGMFSKDEAWGGKDTPYPIMYGKPGGDSTDFATAQANAFNSTWAQLLLQSAEHHQIVQLTSRQIATLDGGAKSFVNLLKKELKSAMGNLSQRLETNITRDGSLNIGRIATGETVSGTVIDLATAGDIVNFEIGDRLVLSASATNTGGLRSSGAAIAVTGVTAGATTSSLTFGAALTGSIAAATAGDYWYKEGDTTVAGASGGVYQGMRGLAAWLPTTAPSAGDSFFGLDRSVSTRLYGFATDASTTTSTFQEALIDGAGNVAQFHGQYCDTATMSPGNFRRLRKEAQLDTTTVRGTGSAGMAGGGKVMEYGYEGVKLVGDMGTLSVVPLFKQVAGTAYVLKKDTWELKSVGPVVRWDDTDGNTILRRATASGIEGRLISWSNLACNLPAANGAVTLPS